MEKQFVTYEIALALKKIGFDEECLAIFDDEELSILDVRFLDNGEYSVKSSDFNDSRFIGAPLWQQAIDFLREKYNIFINIDEIYRGEGRYHFAVNHVWEFFEGTYYEAREQAILKAI